MRVAGPAGPGPRSKDVYGADKLRQFEREADELRAALLPLNLPRAAEHIRRTRPRAEAVALLAFRAYKRAAVTSRRPDITRAAIEAFRAQYARERGFLRGWQTAAAIEFKSSAKTIRKRLRE